MENFITLTESAEKWGISTRRLRTLCEQGRVEGAVKFGKYWAIPVDVRKPVDKRVKSGKYVKHPVKSAEEIQEEILDEIYVL